MLPYALLCGMTTEEFWTCEPRVYVSFIRKHELELDEINYQSWLIGLYTHKAFNVTLANAFSKKSSLKETYFEKPLEELDSKCLAEKNKKKETQSNDYRSQVNYWSKFGKKGV